MSSSNWPVKGGGSPYWKNAAANAAALPTGTVVGEVRLTLDTKDLYEWSGSAWVKIYNSSGTVIGPASATDGAIALFNGTTGKLLKNSAATIDGSGNITGTSFIGPVTGNVTGNVSGSAGSFTGSLVGDITGTQGATVVSTVGGSTAANVHNAELLANAATNANTASTIVKRDPSGNFSAGTITGNVTGNLTGNVTGNTSGSSGSFTGNLVGDVTGTQGATVVASVGGSTAAAVHTSQLATVAATSANTASTIVARDGSGNFAASDPVSSSQVATKNYVDAAVAALNPQTSVFAASTANIAGTYTSVAAGIGDTFTTTATGVFTIDGVTPVLGSRILLKDQTSGYQNGIYTITTLGIVAVSTVFTRALDYNTPSDINGAGLIPVINGTVNALSSWQQVATIVSIGPAGTALVFSEFTANPSLYLLKANNLNDVASASAAYKNLSPLTTAGDIVYESASPAPTRLAIGSTGNILTVSGGLPVWAAPATAGTVTSVSGSGGTTGLTLTGGAITGSGTLTLGGTLVVANGGTGVASVTTAPAATAFAGWDASKNLSANCFAPAWATTVTAAQTTTLTVTSAQFQEFTGSTASQIVKLPVTSNLATGFYFVIANFSTVSIAIQSSGGNAIFTIQSNCAMIFTCKDTTVTTAAGWRGTSCITGAYASGAQAFLSSPTSANLAAYLTDETGSGFAVFATSPTLVTPLLGTPTSGNLSNCTAYPAATVSVAGTVTKEATTTATLTFTQTGGYSQAVTGTFTRVGNVVFVSIPTFSGTSTAAAAIASGATDIPTNYRPATNTITVPQITNNGANAVGLLEATTAGKLNLYASIGGGNFTNSSVCGLAGSGDATTFFYIGA